MSPGSVVAEFNDFFRLSHATVSGRLDQKSAQWHLLPLLHF